MTAVWILAAARTPIGRFGGSLRDQSAVALAKTAATAALTRSGLDPAGLGLSVFGQARQAGSGPNPARQIGLGVGLGHDSVAHTVNAACGSGLLAIRQGMEEIGRHRVEAALVGGTESMSGLPYYLDGARWGYRLGDATVVDANYRDGFFCPITDQLMGATAETLAARHRIGREEQEAYAIASQQRAAAARTSGAFAEELVAVDLPKGKRLEADEAIRESVTPEGMARLPTVFLPAEEGGTVTAGTSSAITDGAAALVLAGGDEPPPGALARLVAFEVAGVDPAVMGIGPVPACKRLEATTGVATTDYDHVELNEAFAAQVLACDRELSLDPARRNPLGGAIALGHPIGCTGARIVVTLVHALRARGGGRGLATLCISGGMGMALAVDVLAP
ncbi:thiolase family protein [bacterium]|nr:thiolase family protein [bacterium]